MKPKEFDDLVRQKFDQNDFAYEARNWDKLAEHLDGRAKKRRVIMWWWIPLTGMAASLLMAMGVTSLMQNQGNGIIPAHSSIAAIPKATHKAAPIHTVQAAPLYAAVQNKTIYKGHPAVYTQPKKDNTASWFNINLKNALPATGTQSGSKKNIDLLAVNVPEEKNKKLIQVEPHSTFKEDDGNKAEPKLAVSLDGGVNHGAINSGYMAGATIRRMLNDKVYIESEVAYSNSTNIQASQLTVPVTSRVASLSRGTAAARTTGASAAGAKSSASESDNTSTLVTSYNTVSTSSSYTQNYAQVTPILGIKFLKRMSVGAGPDFQQMIGDNRPAASPLDRNTIQEAPVFDMGFIGKTEYAVTKKIKAGVFYRKGVNDIISPNDKYVNRDYLQFQLKWVILNK